MRLIWRSCVACCLLVMLTASAQVPATQEKPAGEAGPDAHEIAVPPVNTPLSRELGPMPGPAQLPAQAGLPDVLLDARGKPITTAAGWEKRRPAVRRLLEYYATGALPPAPGNVRGEVLQTSEVLGGKATYRLVRLRFGPARSLTLHIGLFTPNVAAGPKGAGKLPAIIAQWAEPPGAPPVTRLPPGPMQGKGVDVLQFVGPAAAAPETEAAAAATPGKPGAPRPPQMYRALTAEQLASQRADVLSRGYAVVFYDDAECAQDTTLREADGSWAYRRTGFAAAYPEYDAGVLAWWAWGASRVADYLGTLPEIDKGRLIVTGASRAGKAAMIAAAFDDRLHGAPVVTGGGGIGAYRLAGDGRSETLAMMMRKYPNWFSPHLHEFWGHTEKLPFDEDWFLALCAPRPFLALEGDADFISSPRAVKGSVEAARRVYALYGRPEDLGIHYSHHAHAFTDEDWMAMVEFFDAHR